MFCFTQKNIVNTTAVKQQLLCSQKCPERSVCVTGPHNSASVEAFMKPQILNRECSLAGVSASRCVVYSQSYCFWSVPVPAGRGAAFSPVRKTASASFQIILIPSLCPLVSFNKGRQKGFRFRKPHNFREVLAFAYYYLAWFYVLIQNTWNEITQQIAWKIFLV